MELSLFFFAAEASPRASHNRYQLLLDSARFADERGFSAIWTPERHFHSFGGLYPNPSVTSAAIAAVTERIGIRAGSVVMPLHDPLRVAEEWAVVDNLSGGRAGVSFASGWHPQDFTLRPDAFEDRRELMRQGIETVRRLWQGEVVARTSGTGDQLEIGTLPHPIQKNIPIWVTSGGSPETLRLAGELGAGLLTHLVGQNEDQLAESIRIYRDAIATSDKGNGHVTLMLHTLVGLNEEEVRAKARHPLANYLRNSISLAEDQKRSVDAADPSLLDDDDIEFLVEQSVARYLSSSGLFGTTEIVERKLRQLAEAGVDEVACLVDFGVDVQTVFDSLRRLAALVE